MSETLIAQGIGLLLFFAIIWTRRWWQRRREARRIKAAIDRWFERHE
jgi:hypothetical protein